MSDNGALLLADWMVGIVLLVCGVIAWRARARSRVGLIMIGAAGAWFLGGLIGPAVFLHRGPMAHLHISYPTGRLRRPLAWFTVAAAYVAAAVEVVAANAWLTLALAGMVAVAALDLFARTTGRARKAAGPALVAALAFSAALAISSANRLLAWEADRQVLLLYDAVLVLAAVGLTRDLLRGRWSEAALADLVAQVGAQPDVSLRGELRRTLGDPTLELGFWLPAQQRYVDQDGHALDLPSAHHDRSVTWVDDDGGPGAALVHDPSVLDDQRLVESVSSVVRLAVTNARMRAAVNVRVRELENSRRRVIEAIDAQRRALKSEIANGAERRLNEVSRLLGQDLPSEHAEELRELVREVHRAQAELHGLAQGISPASLGSGGLRAAVPELASLQQEVVEVEVQVGRLPQVIESALYFVCSEALANIAKHSGATRTSVRLGVQDGLAVAEVVDNGVGGADPHGSGLRGLADRVEALGGRLIVENAPRGGTRLVARIPVT